MTTRAIGLTRTRLMDRVLTIFLTTLLCLPLPAVGLTIDTFKDGAESVTVDFESGDTITDEVLIHWNYTGKITKATMDVSPSPHTPGGRDYPIEPSLNIGGEGPVEWAFAGTGYGAYGLQDRFIDESAIITKELPGADHVESPGIYIPEGADIQNAQMYVKGEKIDMRYSSDYLGGRSITEVEYSPARNTVFMAASGFGVLARDLDGGPDVLFDGSTYPKIPVEKVSDIEYEDEGDLLFIATNDGLYVINFSRQQIVSKFNINTEPHTLGNTISSVLYDVGTGLLFIGEVSTVTVVNYTTRQVVGYLDPQTWGQIYSMDLDRTNNILWVGTRMGAAGIDLATGKVLHTYTPYTTPSILANQVTDILYDPATDRLVMATRETWSDGGVTIIQVGTGTKYADLTTSSTPALPNGRPSGLEYDTATDELYISTEGGILVVKVGTLTSVRTYDTGSDPPTLSDSVNDILLKGQPEHLIAGDTQGVTVVNVDTGSKVAAIRDLTDNPALQNSYHWNSVVDEVNDRVFFASNNVITILNLSTNEVVGNLTFADVFPPNKCDYFTELAYKAATDQLCVACRLYGIPRLAIYNLTEGERHAYYDSSTTPKILSSGQIFRMDYDEASDQLIFTNQGTAVTFLNLTTNTTWSLTTTSSPLSLPNANLADIEYSAEDDKLFVSVYGWGVAIYDLTSSTLTQLDVNSDPAIGSNWPAQLAYDDMTKNLFITYSGGMDVIDVDDMTLEARYSGTTDPALPLTGPQRVNYDAIKEQLSIADYSGGYVFDFRYNKTLRVYTMTSDPALKYGQLYSFDNYGNKDWDIATMWGGIQVFKPDSYPFKVELRVNGRLAWRNEGELKTSVLVPDFSAALQDAMTDSVVLEPDQYGNVMVHVPLEVVTQRGGNLTMIDLEVVYAHTQTTSDMSAAIQEFINGTNATWDHDIPITVSSSGPGTLKLGDLHVEFDQAPLFEPFPEGLWMYENSVKQQFLDIWEFVHDDIDAVEDLTLEVEAVMNGSKVDIGLFNDHYLYLDSYTRPESRNWTGKVGMVISAADSSGSTGRSDLLVVTVEPRQEIVIASTPPATVDEDQAYVYQVEAVSRRNLTLNYHLDRAPEGMVIDNATGEVQWLPGEDDLGIYAISINVTDGLNHVYQDYDLKVLPVNDPPVFKDIGDLTAFEGVPLVLDLTDRIQDEDDDLADLDLIVRSSYASVNGLVVTFTYPKNSGLGSEDVLFIVSDGKAITSIGKRVTVLGPFTVTTPPDMEAIEGTRAVLDVSGNIHDPQAKALTITTNSKFVTVNGTSLELLYPVGSGVSIDTVRVTVSDGTSGNDTSVSFKVRVTAVFPTISIGEPSNGSEVSGKVKISGTASISSGQVTRVEVRVDNGDWVVANGIASWSLDLDTKDLKNGFHYITARALSNNVSSQEVGVDIDVKNSGPETMTAGNLLAIGIMIGLIIAVVIGVIGYVIGRGKRRPRPPEEGHRPARQGRERRGPDRELEEGSADTEAPDKDMGHGFDPVPEPGPMHDLETDHALQDTGSEAEIADSQETDLGPDAGARTGPEDADVEPHGPPEAEKPGIGDWTAESEMMAEEDAVDRSSSEGDHDGMDGGHEKDAKKEKVEDTLDDILSKLQ